MKIEVRCHCCGNPLLDGNLLTHIGKHTFDKGLSGEYCEDCIEKHCEEISGLSYEQYLESGA